MSNIANGVNQDKTLIATTVRFTEEAISAIDNIASIANTSRANIIRYAVDNRLSQYLKGAVFVEHEDAAQYHEDAVQTRIELAKIYNEMQSIRTELNRIGINFNQELKLKQIAKKYDTGARLTYMQMNDKVKEEESIKRDSQNLKKDELDALMKRYEMATGKVRDAVCHIQEYRIV